MTIKPCFHVPSWNILSCGKPPAVKDNASSEKEGNPSPTLPAPALPPPKSASGCLRISPLQMKFRRRPTPHWLEDFRLEIQGLESPDVQKLELHKANIGHGVSGSVSIFKDKRTGREFAGKFLNSPPDSTPPGGSKSERDELVSELEAYKIVYEKEGLHTNLVNVYGIAMLPNQDRKLERALLMDYVPGPNGREMFKALRKCWSENKITHAQYCSAIQFIGRRLFDVAQHMSKANIVHNDIKPKNFLVNEVTGEPVLIDLAGYSEKGAIAYACSNKFCSPEALLLRGVNEKSDMFAVAATLLAGMEKNKRVRVLDEDKNSRKFKPYRPESYPLKTAYTDFLSLLLQHYPKRRPDSERVSEHDFFWDSMLDDDAARETLTKVMRLKPEMPHDDSDDDSTPAATKEVELRNDNAPDDGSAREAIKQMMLLKDIVPDSDDSMQHDDPAWEIIKKIMRHDAGPSDYSEVGN